MLVRVQPYIDGWFDYNDLATQSTPYAYTTGTTDALPNDGQGTYSQSGYAPTGVTNLWNVSTNQFDFSELNVGDEIHLRVDLVVTTTIPNQEVEVELTFDIGGSPFNLTLITESYKLAGTYQIVHPTQFYIGYADMKNNPAEVRFTSDADASIVINGFYISVKRRY